MQYAICNMPYAICNCNAIWKSRKYPHTHDLQVIKFKLTRNASKTTSMSCSNYIWTNILEVYMDPPQVISVEIWSQTKSIPRLIAIPRWPPDIDVNICPVYFVVGEQVKRRVQFRFSEYFDCVHSQPLAISQSKQFARLQKTRQLENAASAHSATTPKTNLP